MARHAEKADVPSCFSRPEDSTTAWYREYQSVVLRIPRRGTVNTKAWYYEYHAVVLLVPKRLITVVLKSVTIPNGLDCRDK